MRALKNREWVLIREVAAELSLRRADRSALERIVSYIQTQRPTYPQLMDWLDAFERDGFLGARSKQTWNHARVAKNVVEVLADNASDDPAIIALMLAHIAHLTLYYEGQRDKARRVAPHQAILSQFSERDQPPPLPSIARAQPKPQDALPDVRDDVSDTASEFMKFLQNRSKKTK